MYSDSPFTLSDIDICFYLFLLASLSQTSNFGAEHKNALCPTTMASKAAASASDTHNRAVASQSTSVLANKEAGCAPRRPGQRS